MAYDKQPPSYAKYEKINKNVEGINWNLVNSDRKQIGRKPFAEVTTFKK